MSSRLMEYKVRTQLHARRLGDSHGEAALRLIGRVAFLELTLLVLARALDAFPVSSFVRTLDALHLAFRDYLRSQGQSVAFASYDRRMAAVARAMDIPLLGLEYS